MNDLTQLPKEVLDKLQLLADKLGVSIQFVYEQLVKDNTRLGLIGIIAAVVVMLICVGVVIATLKVVPKILAYISARESWSDDGRTTSSVITIILTVFLLVGMFITACNSISNGINDAKRYAAPNKYTIEDIRDLIHGESLVNAHQNKTQ